MPVPLKCQARTPPRPNSGEPERREKRPRFAVFCIAPQNWGGGAASKSAGRLLLPLLFLIVCATGRAGAAPPAHLAAPSPPTEIPDYGGRDSAPLAVGDAAPNPAAQAGRAFEALVVVLAGVAGTVYALKRFGWVTPGADGQPARIALPQMGRSSAAAALPGDAPVRVVSSQALPGGAMLHVVRVSGKNLLLAATAQSVTSVAEWPAEAEALDTVADFEEYLSRADGQEAPSSGIAAANARLRSLLSRPQPEELP